MPTIEERIVLDTYFDCKTFMHVGVAYDFNSHEVYVRVEQRDRSRLMQNLYEKVSSFMKEWPTCDQISTSEPQYRKTTI